MMMIARKDIAALDGNAEVKVKQQAFKDILIHARIIIGVISLIY